MMIPALNPADVDTALDAVKATYEQLVKDGIDPGAIVIAMSEIIAYCLAQKALSGGGSLVYGLWLDTFEKSYREQLNGERTGKR